MKTILKGQASRFTVAVRSDGKPVPIDTSSAVSARLFSLDGEQALTNDLPCSHDAAGASWSEGVVVVQFEQPDTDNLDIGECMLVLTGPFGVRRFKIFVEDVTAGTRSALFVKDFVIEEVRSDGLMVSARNLLGDHTLTDDYIWKKILAAEAHIARELRVPLVPTKFFPGKPTQEQIEALNGMPWGIDPGYDYKQDMFFPDEWGMIKLHNRPLISIESVDFDFPTMGDTFFKMPIEWLRTFDKYGHVQFVPSTPALFSSAGAFVMRALTGYRVVPMMVKVTYIAGIENAARDYPDLLDAVKKKAVLLAIEDRFPADSGSISADGLSQSVSIDLASYRETVNVIIHGEKGTNGGLMTAIHGIRSVVLGG